MQNGERGNKIPQKEGKGSMYICVCVLGGRQGAAVCSGGTILFTVNNNCDANIMCIQGCGGGKLRGLQAEKIMVWNCTRWWLNAMHDLTGLTNLKLTPGLGISGCSVMRKTRNGERVWGEEGGRGRWWCSGGRGCFASIVIAVFFLKMIAHARLYIVLYLSCINGT